MDYNDESSLVEALRGQDALVITLGAHGLSQEVKLVQAAATAGVPWILPNEWGFDTGNKQLSRDVMLAGPKEKTRDLIVRLGKSSYIAVCTGFWYEWSLAIDAAYGFDFANRSVTFFDDGEQKINTSTWPQVGRAVASLLSLKVEPEGDNDDEPSLAKYRNKHVYVSSFTVNQKDILESAMRVTKTSEKDWTVTREPSHERYRGGVEHMQKNGYGVGFVKLLYTRVFFPDGAGNVENTKGLLNETLGLPKEDLDEYTKIAIQRAEQLGGSSAYLKHD